MIDVKFNKVLLVEDDPIAVMLCSKVIQKSSFAAHLDTAYNGQQALTYYQELAGNGKSEDMELYPRVILLDLNMPVLGGWEFLDEFIRAYYPIFPETRVAILSSSIVPDDRERAQEYDIVVDFLSKPITMKDLQTLSHLIG